MASTSTVPAAKAGILALMASALSGVQTSWAHPGKHIARESVFMTDAEFSSEEVVALRPAPHKQTEKYVIPVWVDVLFEGDDAQSAETRMWTLVGLIETAVRNVTDWQTLMGVQWCVVKGKAPQEYMSDQGRGCRCRINLDIQGRS